VVDKTLLLNPEGVIWFQTKQIFWMYVFPMIMGFLGVLCIQIYQRVGQVQNVTSKIAFLCAGCSAMLNLWGWAHMVRTPAMIPFYGCGVGLMAAMMAKVHAIVIQQYWGLKLPRVIWKGDSIGIAELQVRVREMRARSVAQVH
jgi:hypothetical protein